MAGDAVMNTSGLPSMGNTKTSDAGDTRIHFAPERRPCRTSVGMTPYPMSDAVGIEGNDWEKSLMS